LIPLFLPTTLPSWSSPHEHVDAAADLAARLKSFRSAAKVWKRKHRFNPLLKNNWHFLIDLFDFLEESRVISAEESLFRGSSRSKLANLVLEHAARQKQRGKFKAIIEGNENIKFFHARTSQCLRKNSIRSLDIDGAVVASHEAKVAALFSYYCSLLGCAPATSWDFDIDMLYSAKEIEDAVRGMDRFSAPGPDGLGPNFYRAGWAVV
jgi:hypothetical protein